MHLSVWSSLYLDQQLCRETQSRKVQHSSHYPFHIFSMDSLHLHKMHYFLDFWRIRWDVSLQIMDWLWNTYLLSCSYLSSSSLALWNSSFLLDISSDEKSSPRKNYLLKIFKSQSIDSHSLKQPTHELTWSFSSVLIEKLCNYVLWWISR